MTNPTTRSSTPRPFRPRSRRRLSTNYDPATTNIPAGTAEYVAILGCRVPGERMYLDPERRAVYKLRSASREESRSEGPTPLLDEERPELSSTWFEPIFAWGMPKLLAITQFDECDAPGGQRTLYRIEIAGIVHDVSHDRLHDGSCWEQWAAQGVAVAGRRDATLLAKLTIAQALPALQSRAEYHVPVYQGRVTTGWHVASNGQHRFCLPDGRLIGAEGVVPDECAHLNVRERSVAPYVDVPDGTACHTPHLRVAQRAALQFYADLGPRSVAPLVLLAALRSLAYDLLPIDCGLILRGPTQSGKSSISSTVRNLTGRFVGWPLPAPSASFLGTGAAMERPLGELRSLPTLLDDLIIRTNDPERVIAEKSETIDRLFRSLANSVAVRERMRRDMSEQTAYTIRSMLLLTAEELPPAKPSLLARVVLLDLQRGDLELAALRTCSDAHADGLRSLGWCFLAWLANRWDAEGDAFLQALRARHAELTEALRRDLVAVLSYDDLPGEVTRLPSNGAHLLLALELLQAYCASYGIDCPLESERLRRDLLTHLAAQVATIRRVTDGVEAVRGESLSEWTCRTLREALLYGRAHVSERSGSPPLQGEPGPADCGWQRDAHGDYAPRGPLLGERDLNRGWLLLKPESFESWLRTEAARDKRQLPEKIADIYARLVADGVIVPGSTKTTRPVKLNGKDVRRLVLPMSAIWHEDDPPEPMMEIDADGSIVMVAEASSLPDAYSTQFAPTSLGLTPSQMPKAPTMPGHMLLPSAEVEQTADDSLDDGEGF